MDKNKQQKVKLPRLKSQVTQGIDLKQYNDGAIHQKPFVRYNTECVGSYRQKTTLNQPQKNNLVKLTKDAILPNSRRKQIQKKSHQEKTVPYIRKKKQIITLLESNRESLNHQNRPSAIDTRKSIKILINYFQSKVQEVKNVNVNCYHSPKKHPYSLVEASHAAENYRSIRRSFLDNRKRNISLINQERSTSTKKPKRPNIAGAFKIQNALIASSPIRSQDNTTKKEKKNSGNKGNYSVVEIKQSEWQASINKVTQFGAWMINNPQDTEYFS